MNMRLLSAAALPGEIFLPVSASVRVSLWISSAIICVLQRFPGRWVKNARDLGAVIDLALQIQGRPDDFGAIPHDTNAHAGSVLAGKLKARSIVLNGQLQAVFIGCQSHNDSAGFTMIDGV